MATFVKDFRHDIFISYAHANNLPEIEGDKGWVAKFHGNLVDKLTQLIGRRENFEIFCDPEIRGLDDHDVKITGALRSSALMVLVLSPAWLASTYCVQELDLFWDTCAQGAGPLVGDACRVIKVGYDQVAGEDHPEKVRKFSGYPFFDYNKDTSELTRFRRTKEEDPDQRYWKLLDRLARHIHQVLLQMAPQPQEPALPSDAPAVFLGEVTDDLRDLGYREQLAKELRQQGIRVLRKPLNGQTPQQHEATLAASIRDARLSLHCIGEFYGRTVAEDDPRSEIEFQYEVARRQNAPRIVWAPKDVPAPKAGSKQAQFIESLENEQKPANGFALEFIRAGIEDIKDIVIRRLIPPKPMAGSASKASAHIHISCTPNDDRDFQTIKTLLLNAGHTCTRSKVDWLDVQKREENLEQFRRRIQSCDGLVIFYVNAPEDVVVDQAVAAYEIDRSRIKNPLRVRSVFAGPPAPSADIDFASNDWVIFDGTAIPNPLMTFWQRIQPILS